MQRKHVIENPRRQLQNVATPKLRLRVSKHRAKELAGASVNCEHDVMYTRYKLCDCAELAA